MPSSPFVPVVSAASGPAPPLPAPPDPHTVPLPNIGTGGQKEFQAEVGFIVDLAEAGFAQIDPTLLGEPAGDVLRHRHQRVSAGKNAIAHRLTAEDVRLIGKQNDQIPISHHHATLR